MELKNYRRTDLALELQEEQGDAGRGIDFTERQEGKVTVSTLTVKNKEGAELLGSPGFFPRKSGRRSRTAWRQN